MDKSPQAYELLTLKSIFDTGNRQLRVPDYQRGYSWEIEQRTDLIEDIKQVISHSHRHFTGTVVASSNAKSSVFDLVDGQQRITSLIILISCLMREAKSRNITSLVNMNLKDIESIYIKSGAESGNTCYQLQLGIVRDPLFQEVLNSGKIKIQEVKNKSDQNIIDAAEQFSKFVSDLDNKGLDDLYNAVTEKLGFLFYAPEYDAEIGIMFEVINNRGKPLSELEKIKNYLIYFAGRHDKPDLKKKVNSSWPLLLDSLNKAGYTSNDDENRFLRVCWLVFQDYNKSRSYHVYDNLKLEYKPSESDNWEVLVEFINFIVGSAKTYENLHRSSDSSLSENEKIYLRRVSLHPANASVLPLIVSIYAIEQCAVKRSSLLDLIEKLNFRYYVTGIANRNDSGQGDLFQMGYDFYNDKFKKTDAEANLDNYQILQSRIVNFINQNANDYKFVQYLTLDHDEAGDYYKWQGLKYFLGSYEDSLLENNKQSSQLERFVARRDKIHSNDFFHQEHIWARDELSIKDDKEDLGINKRRLGNFIILMETINIKVSNHRIEKKIDDYFKYSKSQPNTLMIRELKEDFETAEKLINKSKVYKKKVKGYWFCVYEKFLDIREQRMVNFAIKRWAVEGIRRPVTEVILNSNSGNNEIFQCLPDHSGQKTDNND